MKQLTFVLACVFALSACSVTPGGTPATGKLVTVKGDVKIVAPKAFKLKVASAMPRVPYELNRLDHIEVWVENTDLGGGPSLAGTLPYQGSTDTDHTFAPIELKNLKSYSHYKVTLKAFQFDPAANAGAGDIIQVDENGAGESETTFDTLLPGGGGITDGANEYVEIASGFNLRLRDQAFNGRAVGGLDTNLSVVNGALLDPIGPEEVELPPAPPALTFDNASSGDLFMNTAGLQGPDGEIDGHFKLALDLPPGSVINEIWLDSIVGRSWHSVRGGFWWGLGVKDENGTLLNPTAEESPLGTFSGPIELELITHSGELAYTAPGTTFTAYVALAGGTTLQADLTIPAGTPPAVDLTGFWHDSESTPPGGNAIQITMQANGVTTATYIASSWTPPPALLSGLSIPNFVGTDGTVTPDGNRIDFTNGSHWTRDP